MARFLVTARCYDKRGRMIGYGTNSYTKTHPLMASLAKGTPKPDSHFLHAEVAALLHCGDKKPHSIHVERFKKDGSPGTAMPCEICMKAIKRWGVKQVTFTVG